MNIKKNVVLNITINSIVQSKYEVHKYRDKTP